MNTSKYVYTDAMREISGFGAMMSDPAQPLSVS